MFTPTAMLFYVVKTYPQGELACGFYLRRRNAEKEVRKIEAAGGKARILQSALLLRPAELRTRIAETASA